LDYQVDPTKKCGHIIMTGGRARLLQEFAVEVAGCRKRCKRALSLLVVIADIDTDEYAQLRGRLCQCLDTPIGASEPIAILLPKRNIETWIKYLQDGPPATEEDDFHDLKRLLKNREGDCRAAVRRYIEMFRQGQTSEDTLPALDASFGELKRIP
ncbi:MAG: hypothetical protein KKI08_15835, partial [Armatimonadetes bacterium]|nr:hypothetical protein [Armatimonadota bacterium]